MRIAFIHLSDFHLKGYEDALDSRADKAVRAVRGSVLGDDVYPVLVITGDFAFSGQEPQFRPMIAFVRRLVENASKAFGHEARLAIVPGNHDTPLQYDCVKELDDFLLEWKDQEGELYQSGLGQMGDFFDFANDLDIEFDRNTGTCVSQFKFDHGNESERVRVVCLSSAPLSSKGNEQGRHYLPLEALAGVTNECSLGQRVPYTAVLVHHPEYWFDDATKRRLESAFDTSVDFLFTGHEHMPEHGVGGTEGEQPLCISRAGEFARSDWSISTFSCVVFNSVTHIARTQLYTWHSHGQFYKHEEQRGEAIVYPKGAIARPQIDFVRQVSTPSGPAKWQLLDYYQFPRLFLREASSDILTKQRMNAKTVLDEDSLFDLIHRSKVVNIVGSRNSGKTALLKYLYLRSLELGYAPLLLDQDSAHKSFDTTLTDLIRHQYGNTDAACSRYEQLDGERKILLIDDFASIRKRKKDAAYLMEALESVGTIVLTGEQPLVLDERDVEHLLDLGEDYVTVGIGGFTKTCRDQLVHRICELKGVEKETADEVALAISHSVTEYHYMFPLNPGFILEYMQYAFESGDKGDVLVRCEKPFGEVYKANIDKMLGFVHSDDRGGLSDNSWKQLLSDVLCKAAFKMHEQRNATLSAEDFVAIVKSHIQQRGLSGIAPSKVFDSLVDTGFICTGESGKYRFYNLNQFAFFIAKDICDRIDYRLGVGPIADKARSDLERILDEVTYGINESILIFLSFLKATMFVPLELCGRGSRLLEGVTEASHITFVKEDIASQISFPSGENRAARGAALDVAEERMDMQNDYSYADLYDYEVEDIKDTVLAIPRAIKYIELATRALSSNYVHALLDDKQGIIDEIESVIAKAVGLIEHDFASYADEVIDHAYETLRDEDKDSELSRDYVANLYTSILMGIILGMVDQVASSMSEDGLIAFVCDEPGTDGVSGLFHLMACFNHSSQERFCNLAGRLAKEARDHGKYGDSLAIAYVVGVYVMEHPSLPDRLVDKLSDEVFSGRHGSSGKARKGILVQRMKDKR